MIKLIAVGKIKERYIKDGIDDYLQRIKKYTKIEIIEIKDTNIEEEKESILKVINKRDYIITLDIAGNNLTSIELANKMNKILQYNSNITFIIGSSLGLHQTIKELANFSLSFSKLTFPHQLFRLIFLEQLYRSYKINNNETYHK
ncbi:MAG: 23S rRNA (pseudouridine(1915)-N(3))-methyltransferase RlmH [bacterium]|nr:23S rRNA (pseudouridine(1915)-N(3))-methyltransferase RlmH [bacterium]